MSARTRLASVLIIVGLGLASLSGQAWPQAQDKPAQKPAAPAAPAAAKGPITKLPSGFFLTAGQALTQRTQPVQSSGATCKE